MGTQTGHKFNSSSLCILIVLLIPMLVGCSQTATQPSGSADDVEKWQTSYGVELDSEKIYRENIHLFDYDEQLPLDIIEGESWENGDVTFTDITYASPKGGRVPATIIEPSGTGPFAGIIIQHGMPSNRQSEFGLAKLYAQLGAVVIAIDAPFARPENAHRAPLMFSEQDREDHIQLIVDLRRAVDLLVSMPTVDPNRLGYVGISYGGMAGGLLAGVEDRLKTYVLTVGDGGLVDHLMVEMEGMTTPLDDMSEEVKKQWIDMMWPIESIHYVPHAEPAALFFQNGTKDRLVPPYLAEDYQNAGSEPKTIKWYDSGHFLPFEHILDQFEWMSQHVGITDIHSLPSVNLLLMNPVEDFILLVGRYRTAALVIDRIMLVWFVLVIGSMIYLAWKLWRQPGFSNRAKLSWLLAALFFGPLGLWAYHFSQGNREIDDSNSVIVRKRVIRSTFWGVVGNLVGMIAVIGILELEAFPDDEIYDISGFLLTPLLLGLPFLTRWALDKFTQERGENQSAPRYSFLPTLVSTNMVLSVGYPVFALLIDQWLSRWYVIQSWDLSSPPFWAIASLVAFIGAAIDYPTHLWMIKTGLLDWGKFPFPKDSQGTQPGRRKVLTVVALSFIFLFFCLLLTFGVILE